MSIEKSDPRLTAYALDELSAEERRAFEAELEQSEGAQHELVEIERTLHELRFEFLDADPVKLESRRRVEIEAAAQTKVRAGRTSRRRKIWGGVSLGAVAASVLLLTMTHAREDAGVAVVPSEAVDSAGPTQQPPAVVEAPPVAVPAPPAEGYALAPSPRSMGAPRPSRAPSASNGPPPHKWDWRENPGIESGRVAGAVGSDDRPHPSQAEAPLPRAPLVKSESQDAPEYSAGVKAGEWDDNANYREFMRWLQTRPAPSAHFVDLRHRRFIVVRDAAGQGVPNCRVVIEDDADRRTELVTAATGRAVLFPHAEGLTGQTFTASTTCEGGAQVRFDLAEPDGVVALRLAGRRVLNARTIDVAFVLDSTGSMSEEIAAVKATIQKVATSLRRVNVRVRVGLVEYKDRSDTYVTKVYPLSSDLARFSTQVAALSASGGGDTPESVNEALHVAVEQLSWSDESFARLAFLVGDAPPHLDYPQDYDYILEAREAAHRGIQVFTVAASGMDTLGQVVWRQVAAYTGATNLFVLRGGAGPQSVGAGDPKSSCGGTQTAYTSGNLDALVLAKIQGAVRALERDPMRIPGLNADENSKPCANRIAQ